MISNTDDHLRNHAFLYEGQSGWRLSPVYDVNPTPVEVSPRVHSTAIDLENTTASLEVAQSVISDFNIKPDQAQAIIQEVGQAVSQWKTVATRLGLSQAEQNRMSSAFEHDDLVYALKIQEQ